MTKFAYVAITQDNKPVSGIHEATERLAVIDSLIKQGLHPVEISEASKVPSGFSLKLLHSNKIKSDDIVIFTRQLSAMVGAGVPLLRALTTMAGHTASPGLKQVLTTVIQDIESGMSLGEALASHPNTFNDVYVNMVNAGEAAGILDEILNRLALQQEKNATIRKKVKSAMAYPAVLMVITVLAFFGLMLFVIPQIGEILTDLGGEDAELPALTQAMLAISDFIRNFWFIVIPSIFGLFYLFIRYIRTPTGKLQFHTIVLKIPILSTIIKKVAVARFARTFASLMGAGVAVLEALDVTGRAIGNKIYERSLTAAADNIKNGDPLSSIIEREEELFPAIVAQMLAVGEETGQTEAVLGKVAAFYEEEVDVAIGGLSSIIEPVMIVIMGSMVGLIAASVMGPIAGLAQNIQG